MTAAASYQQQLRQHSAGRSRVSPQYIHPSKISSPVGVYITPEQQQSASLATKLNNEYRAGAHSSSTTVPRSYQRSSKAASRGPQLQPLDTKMSSYASVATMPAKLHKRGHSGSSFSAPGPPSPLSGAHSQFTTPFATYEESFPIPNVSATTPVTSTPKIKPYLRKISDPRKDSVNQGRIDLSKPSFENDRLAGLGIQDFGSRSASASDVTFPHAGRKGTHARTTSVGSQVSTGSGSFRPTQPFVHPMRQTPRPYTPPTGSANASFVNDQEASESDDVIDDDFKLGHGFRTRRSMSISNLSTLAPTPLSQSHTVEDLGYVPKLTSPSATNLSVKSGRSVKSSKSRHGRPRRDTERSFEHPNSPSTRTSIDKAFSFVSRKSDPDPQARDERIRAARRKFEEKEAHKDRKWQRDQIKRRETDESKREQRQERQRRKSEASERTRTSKSNHSSPRKKERDEQADNEKFQSRSYDEHRPAHAMSLPRQGREAGASEKKYRVAERKPRAAQSGWVRFSAWFHTRLLSCAGGR